MKNNLLLKTIVSCIVGVALWCGIDFVICACKKTSFVDTFCTVENIVEIICVMTVAGYFYYVSQKKKNK